jgi:hypothetical protein
MRLKFLVGFIAFMVLGILLLNYGVLRDEEELDEVEALAVDRAREKGGRSGSRGGRRTDRVAGRNRTGTKDRETEEKENEEEAAIFSAALEKVNAKEEAEAEAEAEEEAEAAAEAEAEARRNGDDAELWSVADEELPHISDVVASSVATHTDRLGAVGADDPVYWLGGDEDEERPTLTPAEEAQGWAKRVREGPLDPYSSFLAPNNKVSIPLPLSVGLPVKPAPRDAAALALGTWWNWTVDEPTADEGTDGTDVGGFSCGLRDAQAARVPSPPPLFLDPTHTAIIVDDAMLDDSAVSHALSLIEATFTSAIHEFRMSRIAQREEEATFGKNERRRRRRAREATAARAGSPSYLDWFLDYVPVKEATMLDASTRLAAAARARAGIPDVTTHREILEEAGVFKEEEGSSPSLSLESARATFAAVADRLAEDGVVDRLVEVEEEEEEEERLAELQDGREIDGEEGEEEEEDDEEEEESEGSGPQDLIYSATGAYWMSRDAAAHEPLRLLIGPVPAGTLVQRRSDEAGLDATEARRASTRTASVTAWLTAEWMRMHDVAAICLLSGRSLRAGKAGATLGVCEELRDSTRLPVLYLDVDGAIGSGDAEVRQAVRRFVLRADVDGLAVKLASTATRVDTVYRGDRLQAPPTSSVGVPSLQQGRDCDDRLSSSHCPPLFIVGGEMKCGTLAVPTLLQAKLPTALKHRDSVLPLHRILGNGSDPEEIEVGGGEDDFWSSQITRGLQSLDVLSDSGLVPATAEAADALSAYLRFSYLTWTKDQTSLRLMPRSDWRAGTATWEKSPSYLKASMAPARIAALLPGTHLVFLLCDPIRRTHTRWFDGHVKHALRDARAVHADKMQLKKQFVRQARHELEGPTALQHTRVLLTALTKPRETRRTVDSAVRLMEGWADEVTEQGVAAVAAIAATRAACLDRHRRGKLVLPQVYSLLANKTSPPEDEECVEIVRRALDATTPTAVNVTHLLPRSHAEQTYALLADAALGTKVGGTLSILTGAHFAPSVERWLRVQGRDRVHVLDSEAIVADADATLTPVLQALGAPAADIVSLGHQPRHHHFNKPFPFMDPRIYQALSAYYCRSFAHLAFLLPRPFGRTWLAKSRPPLDAVPVYSDKETQHDAEMVARNFSGILYVD